MLLCGEIEGELARAVGELAGVGGQALELEGEVAYESLCFVELLGAGREHVLYVCGGAGLTHGKVVAGLVEVCCEVAQAGEERGYGLHARGGGVLNSGGASEASAAGEASEAGAASEAGEACAARASGAR